MPTRKDYLRGPRIDPRPVTGKETVPELVENAFLAYNAGRLAEGCRLFAERMLEPEVTVGMSLTGAMTPAGLGMSTIIPLIEAGFIDWIVSTGANLYHDAHFGLGLTMHQGTPFIDDVALREEGVVRIYDIFFDYEVLLSTDAYVREVSARPEFQRPMSTAEYHYLLGGYILEREQALGITRKSVLGVAHRCSVPIYTSSPGDSSIGMNVAEQALAGSQLRFDVSADVNETSAIVFAAKVSGGKSGVLIIGGGGPQNFVLQTQPQIQEGPGVSEKGDDHYPQLPHAPPHTRGGAHPQRVRGVPPAPPPRDHPAELPGPQRGFCPVRADQAGPRPERPEARLARVRVRDRALTHGTAARSDRRPQVPPRRDRLRRGAVGHLHHAGRRRAAVLAAVRLPGDGRCGGGGLRAGGAGADRGVLPGAPSRVRHRRLLGGHGLRRGARRLAGRRAHGALRLARDVRHHGRPGVRAGGARIPAARAVTAGAGAAARDRPRLDQPRRAAGGAVRRAAPPPVGGRGGGQWRPGADRRGAVRARHGGVRRIRRAGAGLDRLPPRPRRHRAHDGSRRGGRDGVPGLSTGGGDRAPHADADLDVHRWSDGYLRGERPHRLGADVHAPRPRPVRRGVRPPIRGLGTRRRRAGVVGRRPDGRPGVRTVEWGAGARLRSRFRAGRAGVRRAPARDRDAHVHRAPGRDVVPLYLVQRAPLRRDLRRRPPSGAGLGAGGVRALLPPRRGRHRAPPRRALVGPVRAAPRDADPAGRGGAGWPGGIGGAGGGGAGHGPGWG